MWLSLYPTNKKGVPKAANCRFEDPLRTRKNNGGWNPSMKPEQKNPPGAELPLPKNPVVVRGFARNFKQDKNS